MRYPADDLLDIVCLESHRAGAVVVGEDLGTVEDGVREALAERGILGYRVLWFEDDDPAAWPELAMAAVTTHDLPTVAGLWTGSDTADVLASSDMDPDDVEQRPRGAARPAAPRRAAANAGVDDALAAAYRPARPRAEPAAHVVAGGRARRGAAAQRAGHHRPRQLAGAARAAARGRRPRRSAAPTGRGAGGGGLMADLARGLVWGLISGGALVVGAAVAWFVRVPRLVVAGVMAFGAGVLISALAFELVDEAEKSGGLAATVAGLLGGAAAYVAANVVLARRGARHRKRW